VAPRLKKETVAIRIERDTACIVAVADTHSSPHPAIAERLAALAPDAILHAGDIGELSLLDDLARAAPLFAVRGNIDTRARDLPDVLTLELAVGAKTLRILMTHIAVYGPRLRADIAKMARAERAPLVVCGHSHVPFIGGEHDVTVFNPGSIGPRRFSLPIVFGVIDVSQDGVRLRHVDCETGRAWSPPGP
jgi:putative phosphoesterase